MIRTVCGFAAIALGACGGSESSADGNDRDARRDSDAATTCTFVPPAPPAPASGSVTVAFDSILPMAMTGDGGAIAMRVVDDDVVVVGSMSSHRVTPLGAVTTLVYEPSDPSAVVVVDAHSYGDQLGALVRKKLDRGGFDFLFCILGVNGEYDSGRCVSLATDLLSTPRVSDDGDSFSAYAIVSGHMHRWALSNQPVILASEDLWAVDSTELAVVAASAPGGVEMVLTYGLREDTGCATLSDRSAATLWSTATDLLPSDAVLGSTTYLDVSSDGEFGVLFDAACRSSDSADPACVVLPSSSAPFVLSYLNGVAERRVIELPDRASTALFYDSGSIVVAYVVGLSEVSLSRFPANSVSPDISRLGLPLDYATGDNEVQRLYGGVAVGPGDYSLVYTVEQPDGSRSRIARFSVD